MVKKQFKNLAWCLAYFLPFSLYAADDIKAKLSDSAGAGKFVIRDSGDINVATIDSDGNTIISGYTNIAGSATVAGTNGLGVARIGLAGNVVISSGASAGYGGGVQVSTHMYIVGFASATKYFGDGSGLYGVTGAIDSAVRLSTGTIRTDLNTVKVDTGTLMTDLAAVKVATGTLRTDLNAVITSTGTLVKKAGDTMTGNLNMSGNNITDISTITASGQGIYLGSHVFVTQGNVGIGTTAPTSKFEVVNGTLTIRATAGTGFGLWINGAAATSPNFIICSTGTATTNRAFRVRGASPSVYTSGAVTTTGADVAEVYHSDDKLESGDLVVSDGGLKVKKYNPGRSSSVVLGIVSENPAFLCGGNEMTLEEMRGAGLYPIALCGRIAVKVCLENGVIKTGDFLTASSGQGYAMKATKSGRVVGVALESFNGNDGKLEGKVLCFVNAHYWVNPDEYQQLESRVKTLEEKLAR